MIFHSTIAKNLIDFVESQIYEYLTFNSNQLKVERVALIDKETYHRNINIYFKDCEKPFQLYVGTAKKNNVNYVIQIRENDIVVDWQENIESTIETELTMLDSTIINFKNKEKENAKNY